MKWEIIHPLYYVQFELISTASEQQYVVATHHILFETITRSKVTFFKFEQSGILNLFYIYPANLSDCQRHIGEYQLNIRPGENSPIPTLIESNC